MFQVPEVRSDASVSDTVTTPLPLAESTMLPEKTLGVGPGANGGRNAFGVEALQLMTMRLADAARQIEAHAIPTLFVRRRMSSRVFVAT